MDTHPVLSGRIIHGKSSKMVEKSTPSHKQPQRLMTKVPVPENPLSPGLPVVAQWKQIRLASTRTQVRSLASLSRLRNWCCHSCGMGSLAGELLHAVGVAEKQTNKQKTQPNQPPKQELCSWTEVQISALTLNTQVPCKFFHILSLRVLSLKIEMLLPLFTGSS